MKLTMIYPFVKCTFDFFEMKPFKDFNNILKTFKYFMNTKKNECRFIKCICHVIKLIVSCALLFWLFT